MMVVASIGHLPNVVAALSDRRGLPRRPWGLQKRVFWR
jgi:hypothetical protein